MERDLFPIDYGLKYFATCSRASPMKHACDAFDEYSAAADWKASLETTLNM